MVGRIAFVTDSTAGMPPEQAEKYRVTVVPLKLMFGTETFLDGIDLKENEFFERVEKSATLPTTSQPSVGDFEAAYSKLLDDPGVDGIISVHISSGLSGTINSASQAAELVRTRTNKPVAVIDSLSGYMGEGLMVINGARAAEKGKSFDDVVKMIEGMVPKMQVLLLVDTLEYLQRGGRIGGAQAFIGTMLSIKPILRVRDGALVPLERVRTRRKAMERLVEIGAGEIDGKPCQIVVGNARAPEDAKTLDAMIHEKMNVVEEFSSELGPVISVHTGPGVLGFVYYPVEE